MFENLATLRSLKIAAFTSKHVWETHNKTPACVLL